MLGSRHGGPHVLRHVHRPPELPGTPSPWLQTAFMRQPRWPYAARTRSGFTPASRAQLFKRFKGLETRVCPFANLPEKKSGRWGAGLTAKKMPSCRWLEPRLVGQFEFLEWTGEGYLRHTRFVALRDDKDAREVVREGAAQASDEGPEPRRPRCGPRPGPVW
jgi:ATP-dependent DNA ligase